MNAERPDAGAWLASLNVAVQWTDDDAIQEAIWIGDPPSMLLRRRQGKRDERWAIFHGIAHLELHRGNQLYLLKSGQQHQVGKQERQAEEWAASHLLPLEELDRALLAGMEGEQLVEHFDVPPEGVTVALSLLLAKQASANRPAGPLPEGWQVKRPAWPHCIFCPDWADGIYQTRADNESMPGWVMRTPLCSRHEEVMYEAGERGRVHGPTGVRYWLLER